MTSQHFSHEQQLPAQAPPPDFPSPALHARRIDDGGLEIYPAHYRGGSHVGHSQTPADAGN